MSENIKILVIDDASFIFTMMEKHLSSFGYKHIYYANSGLKALEMIGKEDYDVITCDITMPEMDGIETARRIFEKKSDQKLIMVTAMGQEYIIRDAIKIGVKHYLLKPFTADKLLEKIKGALNS